MELKTAVQYSVFLVNKPGVLAQVTRALADEKINIVAMTLVDSSEHGVLRFVPANGSAVKQVLSRLNLPMTETEVLVVDLSNRPGALADVATVLGENHININYAYVTSGAPGGRTTGIFKVADPAKAQKVLRSPSVRSRDTNVRRPGLRR